MDVAPKQIRMARAFLYKNGVGGKINPRRFAAARQELGVDFSQLLDLIGQMMAGGQGEQERIQQTLDQEQLRIEPKGKGALYG